MTDLCRKYYVDSINGSDTNDGLSENSAFASLFAINRLALKPGDHILLACGSVFEKQFLQIRDSGTKQMPIVIGSYGCGEDPLIKTDGQGIWYQDYGKELDSPTHVYHGYVSSAVLLFDAEYIIIQDIEITNSADKVIGENYSQADKMERTGVAVVAKEKGLRCGITLRNLKIHDVH